MKTIYHKLSVGALHKQRQSANVHQRGWLTHRFFVNVGTGRRCRRWLAHAVNTEEEQTL